MSTKTKKIEELFLNLHSTRQRILSEGKFFHLEADVTFSQWMALEFIERNNKSSIQQISKALHISSSAATQLINGLEKKGFVLRKIGADDKRFSAIESSPKAKKLFSVMKQKKLGYTKKLFSHFSDKELETFSSLIKKLTINV